MDAPGTEVGKLNRCSSAAFDNGIVESYSVNNGPQRKTIEVGNAEMVESQVERVPRGASVCVHDHVMRIKNLFRCGEKNGSP